LASKHAKGELQKALKRQLPLFVFASTESSATDFINRFQQISSKRERVKALLESELDFHGKDSTYASHDDFHSFAAKFPPIFALTNGSLRLTKASREGTRAIC
jgi:hypothetical protein